MKHIKFLIIILALVFINLVSANGLVILNNTMDLNKTFNIDEDITFQVRNDESFSFHNLTIEQKDIVSMDYVNKIDSGETKTINAKIITNEDYDKTIKLKGYYLAEVGASEEDYFINIDFIGGLSECDKTIIKGDTITWVNLVNDEVILKNVVTGNEAGRIPINSSKLFNFDNPEIFTYSVLRRGYQFTDTCTITVLNDSGLVYNPIYDAFLDLKVSVLYNPTQIQTSVLERDYTMDFYGVKEVAMVVRNIGDEIARNIHFEGNWFADFNHNNFDLEPDESKNILFNIKPVVFSTNETDKLHKKDLLIKGNFVTINETFNIYVNYAEIGDDINTNISTFMDYLCSVRPDLCEVKERVIYRDGRNNSEEFNVTMSKDQVLGLWAYMFELGDQIGLDFNFLKEQSDTNSMKILSMEMLMNNLTNATKEEREARENQSTTGYAFIVIVLFVIIIGLMVFLVYNLKKEKQRRLLERM